MYNRAQKTPSPSHPISQLPPPCSGATHSRLTLCSRFTLQLTQAMFILLRHQTTIPFLESGWSALAISVPGVILKFQFAHSMIYR